MCTYTLLVVVGTYHGSNSWMMLSNRMTANSRAENPDTHARKRMANVMRLFHPAGLVSKVFILTSGFRGIEVNSHGSRSFARTNFTHRRTKIIGNRPPLFCVIKELLYLNLQRYGPVE